MNSDEEIIYVGRTDGEYISDRLLTHSHLPDEAYKEKTTVECLELVEKSDQVIYEIYFINKYKPKYNSSNKFDGEMTIILPESEWIDINKAKKRSVGNQSESVKKSNITKAKNKILGLKKELKLYEDCKVYIDDMIQYFRVAQILITCEIIECLKSEEIKKEIVSFEFKATKDYLQIIYDNLFIDYRELDTEECYPKIAIAERAAVKHLKDSDKDSCILGLNKLLLPYLYCGFSNLDRKIKEAEVKIAKEKIRLEDLAN